MSNKTCETCGFRTLNPQQCPLIGYQYTDLRKTCPYWVAEVTHCSYCNAVIPDRHYALIHSNDGSWKPVCGKCLKLSGTCGSCVNSQVCDFETNPSTIPKAVQKTIQQGNMTTVTTIPNPTRIDITCRVNCQCFSEEFGCLKENGTCRKYKGVF